MKFSPSVFARTMDLSSEEMKNLRSDIVDFIQDWLEKKGNDSKRDKDELKQCAILLSLYKDDNESSK